MLWDLFFLPSVLMGEHKQAAGCRKKNFVENSADTSVISIVSTHFLIKSCLFQFDGAKKLQFNVFTSKEHRSVVSCVVMEDAENRVRNLYT